MVRLIQKIFEDGVVPEEVVWETVVFLPKGRGEYQGIELVKVVWKICATVTNFCLRRSVTLHDAVHGFRAGRGTGTATLEEKLV